jgi:endo-1,4-beta-xylanase
MGSTKSFWGLAALLPAIITLALAGCTDPNLTETISSATVTGVTVSSSTPTVTKGGTATFSAAVAGTNNPAQTVTWLVSGGSSGTAVSAGGSLAVAANESAATLTVTATSTVDTTKSGSAAVAVTGGGNTFVPVTDITGVPTGATTGTDQTLNGTVAPGNATNKTITWSVYSVGSTGASIVDGKLRTTAAGTATVRATITNGLTASTNYTKDFTITVTTGFVPVTNITGVPGTATVGTDRALSGTITPANATNKTITWSVVSAGGTGASIVSGTTLRTTAAGTAKVKATITNGSSASSDYTQDFDVTVATVTPPFVPITNITGVSGAAIAGTDLALSGTVAPANATNQNITWSIYSAGSTGASIVSGNTLRTAGAGTATVRATVTNGLTASSNYTKDFAVTVTLPFVAVTNISDVPGAATVGVDLALSGTVTPVEATNKTITWSVYNAGNTGASIVSGTTLRTTAAGTATVRATIASGLSTSSDYTQDFNITVTLPTLSGSVSITGTAQVGQTLTAVTTSLEGSGAITYQWIRGTSTNVGTNSTTYIPVASDVGSTIKMQVSRAGYSGTVTSGTTAAVLAVGSANITVGFNYGEITITGSDGSNIISKSGAYGPTSLSLSATGYTDVIWYVDGSQTGISGSPVTLNAANYSVQRHSIIFTGTANGHRYSSQAIPFVVNP